MAPRSRHPQGRIDLMTGLFKAVSRIMSTIVLGMIFASGTTTSMWAIKLTSSNNEA